MSFSKMQEALRAEGWFVEWNMPCCQSCAWAEVEHDDLSKVLFNHSQDCVIDNDGMDCSSCDGDGIIDNPDYDPDDGDAEQYIECDYCGGEGILWGTFDENELGYTPDTSVEGFSCMPPEVAGSSTFCFDGTPEGVENLKAVLPIIEAAGCKVNWNESGSARPYITW